MLGDDGQPPKRPFELYRCLSDHQWDCRLADAWDACSDAMIALPPGMSDEDMEALKEIAGALARDGVKRLPPVSAVVGIGPLGETAARFYAWLSGALRHQIQTPDEAAILLPKVCRGADHVLVCFDSRVAQYTGIVEFAAALSGLDATFGFINAYSTGAGVIAAFKAAFHPLTSETNRHVLIDTLHPTEFAISADNLEIAVGQTLAAAKTEALLTTRSRTAIVVSHGNGFDFNLGRGVLCCIDGDIPLVDDPMLFTCFHTGECVRKQHTRIGVASIKTDLLVLATCWGTYDSLRGLNHSMTAFSKFIRGSGVWNLITTASLWTAKREDWMRILWVLFESCMAGEATRRLNRLFRPLENVFFLFGNPLAPCALEALPIRTLGEPDDRAEFSPGLHRLGLPRPASGESGVFVFSPSRTCLFTATDPAGPNNGDLLIAADGPTILRRLDAAKLDPPSAVGLLTDLVQHSQMLDLLALYVPRGAGSEHRLSDIALLRCQTILVIRTFSERRTASGWVLWESELEQLDAIEGAWSLLSRDLLNEWVNWATGEPRPRFFVDLWRPFYRLVEERPDSDCWDCGKPIRVHHYEHCGEHGFGRSLYFCRYCGMKRDIPRERFELSAEFLAAEIRQDVITTSVLLRNGGNVPLLAATQMFLMGADRVWGRPPGGAALIRLTPGQSARLTFRLETPSHLSGGGYWMILLGVSNGAPFTLGWKLLHLPNRFYPPHLAGCGKRVATRG